MPAPYRPDLALVHHLGFGFLADACAPGILALLEPIRARNGLVLELGCGSGALTGHLVNAGHRVVATDASPAMVELAREHAVGADDIRVLTLPDDPLPAADAVVSVGHVLNYLPDEAAIDRALVSIAGAVGPGGVLAIDLCDRRFGEVRKDATAGARVEDDWVVASRSAVPSPDRLVRHITTFVRVDAGGWRRDDERHVNVLLDTALVPARLAALGLQATVSSSFGTERLLEGMVAVAGHRPGQVGRPGLEPGPEA